MVVLKTFAISAAVMVLAATGQAAAKATAPLIPTALVEDVTGASADVAFMDYVGNGQVIHLAPGDMLVLSYLKSCAHETITGGTVTVGTERSSVQDGKVVRTRVACDGGQMRLSANEASQSAASAFRLQSADTQTRIYARAPVVQLPRHLANDERTLVIARTDRKGERRALPIDDAAAAAGFYDLAKAHVSLTRGATYAASIAGRTAVFEVAAKAKSGPAPVVSRLVRLQ